jgi:hypothetical protein
LAWDGEDQAVLGYFSPKGEELVKHRKGCDRVVPSQAARFSRRQPIRHCCRCLFDRPGRGFVRALRLPRDTHSVELLIDDAQFGPSSQDL